MSKHVNELIAEAVKPKNKLLYKKNKEIRELKARLKEISEVNMEMVRDYEHTNDGNDFKSTWTATPPREEALQQAQEIMERSNGTRVSFIFLISIAAVACAIIFLLFIA